MRMANQPLQATAASHGVSLCALVIEHRIACRWSRIVGDGA